MKKMLAVLAGIGAVLLFLAGWLLRGLSGGKNDSANSIEVSKEVQREIENTPAADLIAAAPNADELRSNATGIAEQAKQRFRDRVGAILSGNHNIGVDGSSRIGD
ncbi:MAG: hypothetical protein FWD36_03235 [Treponema sp.]|nr:hypothetical protein [Treponema sp.]